MDAFNLQTSALNVTAGGNELYNPRVPAPFATYSVEKARCHRGPCVNLCCNANAEGFCIDNLVSQGGQYLPSKSYFSSISFAHILSQHLYHDIIHGSLSSLYNALAFIRQNQWFWVPCKYLYHDIMHGTVWISNHLTVFPGNVSGRNLSKFQILGQCLYTQAECPCLFHWWNFMYLDMISRDEALSTEKMVWEHNGHCIVVYVSIWEFYCRNKKFLGPTHS